MCFFNILEDDQKMTIKMKTNIIGMVWYLNKISLETKNLESISFQRFREKKFTNVLKSGL